METIRESDLKAWYDFLTSYPERGKLGLKAMPSDITGVITYLTPDPLYGSPGFKLETKTHYAIFKDLKSALEAFISLAGRKGYIEAITNQAFLFDNDEAAGLDKDKPAQASVKNNNE